MFQIITLGIISVAATIAWFFTWRRAEEEEFKLRDAEKRAEKYALMWGGCRRLLGEANECLDAVEDILSQPAKGRIEFSLEVIRSYKLKKARRIELGRRIAERMNLTKQQTSTKE